MKPLRSIAILGLLFFSPCLLRAQSYSWSGWVHDTVTGNPLAQTVATPVTVVNITASHGSPSTNTYVLESGPAPQVGEYAQVLGVPAGTFQIVALGEDANGNPTFTLANDYNDEGGPHSGTAFIGPGFSYYLHFSAGGCDSQSHITAGFLDPTGTSQVVQSVNVYNCTQTSPDGGYTHVTNGSFSWFDANEVMHVSTFTVQDKNGRFGRYATSVQWTIGPTPLAHCASGPCGS